MNIPFIDLKTQYARLRGEIQAGMDKVLEHGQFIMGPEIGELEKRLAEFAGVKHAVTCSSGTDALLMPLMAKGIGPGDAVFTTPFTFIATAEVISLLGATPVYVDIVRDTFNIDPDKLEAAIEKVKGEGKLKPAAVIPVDMYGLPADYVRINTIAKAHNLFVIEDAAQGFGGEQNGKKAGSLAEVGATSFFPAKPLGCYGDGGAVFTNDDSIAGELKSVRVHGKGKDKYDNKRIGLNARFDTLQAAVLMPKLAVFANELEMRQNVADRYTEGLKDVIEIPKIPDGFKSAWAQYTLVAEKRDEIQAALKTDGIPTQVYYPKPLHLQTAFSGLGYEAGDFPVSEELAGTVFSLPMSPYLTEDQQDIVISALRKAVGWAQSQ